MTSECDSWLYRLNIFYNHYLRGSSYPSGNSYLSWIWCHLLGKNTQEVPKDEPMLKIATEKENSDARRTAVVEGLFRKFEKQSSIKVAWVQLSFTVQLQSNKAYLLNYFWHWSFLYNVNQQLKIIIWNLLFDTFQFVFDSQWHKLTCRTPWLLKHCWYERAKARHKGMQGVFSRASKGLSNEKALTMLLILASITNTTF